MEQINSILQNKINIKNGLRGIASGFPSLDKITNGWDKSDFIVIASRPGMGKTGFVLSMALNMICFYNTPILFFSLESNSTQILIRLLNLTTEITVEKLRTGNFEDIEWLQLYSKSQNLTNARLFLQTTYRELQDIQKECKSFKDKYSDGIIIIDNLHQIINSGKTYQTRDHEMGDIVRELKAFAKELDIPIIGTSFLNRESEKRNRCTPKLSDIKDTGEIENIADIVCLIHRPEYYDIMMDEEGNSTEGLAQIIVAKNRKGCLKDIYLHYRSDFAKFEDLDTSPIVISSKMGIPTTILMLSSIFLLIGYLLSELLR